MSEIENSNPNSAQVNASSLLFNKKFVYIDPLQTQISPSPSFPRIVAPITDNGTNGFVDKTMKILIVGNAKCGKSSLIGRYAHGTFSDEYKTTIGADYIRRDVVAEHSNGETDRIRLQLWDIAGQDRFQRLTRAYFAKAQGVIIVCDVTRDQTIDAVRKWRRAVSDMADEMSNDLPVVLLANKSDKFIDAQMAFRTGAAMEKMSNEEKFSSWHITSAATGEGVEEGFASIIKQILHNEVSHAQCECRLIENDQMASESISKESKSTYSGGFHLEGNTKDSTVAPSHYNNQCCT